MFFHGVPLDCINEAALRYHVPAALIVSVMQVEKGRNGSASQNKNGTSDLGVMQVNTSWLPALKKAGYTREKVQFDPCINISVATWILARSIAKKEGWQGVGTYHSATPIYNKIYREKVKKMYLNEIGFLEESNYAIK